MSDDYWFMDYCWNGNIEKVCALLEGGYDMKLNRYCIEMTGFMSACYRGHIDLVTKMLEYPIVKNNINFVWNKYTALMVSIEAGGAAGREDIFDVLVEHGADINLTNFDGRTPLIHACWCNRVAIVSRLLALGANVNAVDGQYQHPAVFYSTSPEVLNLLAMILICTIVHWKVITFYMNLLIKESQKH